MSEISDRMNCTFQVALVGVAFWIPNIVLVSMVGSMIDHYKMIYPKSAYLVSIHSCCLGVIALCVVMSLSLPIHANHTYRIQFFTSLITAGQLLGILGGVTCDVGVELAYAQIEGTGFDVDSMVNTVFMFSGNLLSALALVHVDPYVKSSLNPPYELAFVLAIIIAVVTYVPLLGFNGEFSRLKLDVSDQSTKAESGEATVLVQTDAEAEE